VLGKLSQLRLHKKSELPFELSDGRNAIILITPQFATRPVIELRVDGQLMVETGKKPFLCVSCGSLVKPNDRFCGVCGHPMRNVSMTLRHLPCEFSVALFSSSPVLAIDPDGLLHWLMFRHLSDKTFRV